VAFDADVIIVGGGPAGSTTALAIAHAAPELARRSMLLERASYPRDKPCAGALGARGDTLLRGIGVEVDVPSVRIDGISFRGSAAEASASPGNIGRVVRRFEFDHALARAAVARGVRLRESVRVDAVHDDGDGVLVRTSAGDMRARAVVGCDGVGSVVRRSMGVGAGRLRAQVVEVDTEPVSGDRERTLLHFDASDPRLTGYSWDFPTTVGGRELVCRGVYQLKVDGDNGRVHRLEVGTHLDARLREVGIDPARCGTKRYAERGFEAGTPLVAGARMLAGEAAGIDPVTGEGIAQAIEYGVLAGRFLARIFGEAGVRIALDEWQEEVARSRLARDLRIRLSLMRLFYGPARSDVERFITGSDDALFVGCQHFASQPYDWPKLGDVVGRGLAGLLGMFIRDALAR
jgi:flavin-dependent dehydrogenase